jgi:hypothetical protein
LNRLFWGGGGETLLCAAQGALAAYLKPPVDAMFATAADILDKKMEVASRAVTGQGQAEVERWLAGEAGGSTRDRIHRKVDALLREAEPATRINVSCFKAGA